MEANPRPGWRGACAWQVTLALCSTSEVTVPSSGGLTIHAQPGSECPLGGVLPKVGWGLPGGGTPQLESRVDRFDLISEDRATSHEDPTNELPQGTQLTLPLPNLLIPLGEILRKA